MNESSEAVRISKPTKQPNAQPSRLAKPDLPVLIEARLNMQLKRPGRANGQISLGEREVQRMRDGASSPYISCIRKNKHAHSHRMEKAGIAPVMARTRR